MSFSLEIEIIGFPSGQIIKVHTAFLQTLFAYGFILKTPEYGWTFQDEDEHRIMKIIEQKDICVF
jgi:hypothetical protein